MSDIKKEIKTLSAPAAIGSYSQGIQSNKTIYLSGQIPLDPKTMTMINGTIEDEINQVFKNLTQVAIAAGADLNSIVKLTVFLTDMADLTIVNEIMPKYFKSPYPARSSIQVAGLPKGARVEVEGVMVI